MEQMRINCPNRLVISITALVVLALLLASVPAVFAQGCVMCQTSASAAGQKGQRALNNAILVLMLPVLGLFLGILGFAWRRNRAPSPRATLTPHSSFEPAGEAALHFSWTAPAD
jgi:hypothetical protein